MSENRKMVVIDLEESEKTVIGELSELQSAEATGVLSINNVSEQNRIWNVRVLLDDTRGRTTFEEDVLHAGEIDAGSQWRTEYGIEIDAPVLTLTEVYDTCSTVESEKPHWAYAFGKENPVRITITVKNECDGQIDDIAVTKWIPPELDNVVIESMESGNANYDPENRQVVWNDFIVYPGESSTLVITATATVEDSSPKDAGKILVTYRAEGQQRSVLAPDMTALTDFLTGIDTAETEPNQWECTLECSNESDLMVRLDRAEAYVEPEGGGEKVKMIDEAPALEMEPNAEWSKMFEIESKSPPRCTHDVVYTPMRTVTKRVLGTIEKVPQTIPVYQIDHMKEFDPPSVASFDKTPVEVTVEVKNVGSARLNEVTVEDHLPDDVMPPKREHITVWVKGEEYTGDYEFSIEPDDQDPEKPHTLTFRITGLKDTVGELEPGESIKINYAIMAWRNRPEKEYPSPIHCTANTYPAGLITEIGSAPDGHKLGVIYKKRRIAVKKGINRGAGAGEYDVVIVVENKGEVTVENVVVRDWIPAGFEFQSVDPPEEEPSLQSAEDGTDLIWRWARMSPGDKKKMVVHVRGEGEYERREPVVTSD